MLLPCCFTGNVMNGPIGKQMVDTLVESSANVEVGSLNIPMCYLQWLDIPAVQSILVEGHTNTKQCAPEKLPLFRVFTKVTLRPKVWEITDFVPFPLFTDDSEVLRHFPEDERPYYLRGILGMELDRNISLNIFTFLLNEYARHISS